MKKLVCFVVVLAVLQVLPGGLLAQRVADRSNSPARIGIYVWGSFPDPESPDLLGEASRDIHSLGTDVARTAITPYWSASGKALDLTPLDQRIYEPEYLLFVSSFKRVMLTAYDISSYDPNIFIPRYRNRERSSDGFTQKFEEHRMSVIRYLNKEYYSKEEWRQYLEEVFQEYRRFGKELVKISSQFGNEIIVSNWEAANDAPQDQMWVLEDGQPGPYIEYLVARLSGLKQGIAEAKELGFRGRVLTAFEFNLIWKGMDPNPWDDIPPREVSDFEIGVRELKALVDVWSYSAWASVFHIPDAKITVEYNRQSMVTAFQRMRQVCKDCRIVIGEIGYLRNFPGSSAVLRTLIETALKQGAETVFSWVLYDQPQDQEWSKFGSFDADGQITDQGRLLRRMIQQEERRGRSIPRSRQGGGRGH